MSRIMRVTCRRLNLEWSSRAGCVLPMIAWLVLVGVPWAGAATVVDFEDLSLPAQSAAPGDASQTPFVSRGVTFNRTWNLDYDCCAAAWAYSNQTDLMTPGYDNPYSAYAVPDGGGAEGSASFAVANNSYRGESQVVFSESVQVLGMYVTNTTYAYRAIVDGNDGAGFVKGPFQADDWFRLAIFGYDAQGEQSEPVEFYLADYRDDGVLAARDWTWVDLTPLGSVERLEFELSSTDMGPFGMNTPAYFAIDDLTFVPAPNMLGDFNANSALNADDINDLSREVRSGGHAITYDLNGDSLVDDADRDVWVNDLAYTYYGDAQLDGQFSSADFVEVFAAGQYEDGLPGNSGWATGDWNGDTEFDSADFVAAFAAGGYEMGPRPPAPLVPEPSTAVLSASALLLICTLRRARSACRS